MTPWLITLRPMFIPTDAREDLQSISDVMTPAQYLDKIWEHREEAKPQPSKSVCNWPAKFDAPNVMPIKKVVRA